MSGRIGSEPVFQHPDFPLPIVHLGRVSRAWFRMHLQQMAQYRVNAIVWAMSSLLQIVVYMSVWRSVASSGGAQSTGYSAGQFAGYFLLLLIVRELTFSAVTWEFPDKVRTGNLSPQLLRPAQPIAQIWASMNAYRTQSMLVLVPAAVLLYVAFDATIETTPSRVALAVMALPFAALVRFMADATLSLVSFWIVRMDGVRGMYYMVMLLLGGQFAPISVLPEWLQQVAYWLPFYWTLGFPVDVVTGRASLSLAWTGLAVLAVWAGLLTVMFRFLWRVGLRRYGAVGA